MRGKLLIQTTISLFAIAASASIAAAGEGSCVGLGCNASADEGAIICCDNRIQVGGEWIGSSRGVDCQDYMNNASSEVLARMCKQRSLLNCINTARCNTLPPDEQTQDESETGTTLSPSDEDGLEQGFGAPPEPQTPPPALPPKRLAYIMPWPQAGEAGFQAWLDGNGCAVPLSAKKKPPKPGGAKHVVRGSISHANGRTRIEARAQEIGSEKVAGSAIGEAAGDDAAAVATVARAAAAKLKLACKR
jgi:hypothetical protein